MNPRTTGIVFAVTALLFASVYWFEIRGEAGRVQAEDAAKRLFADVGSEDVDWIALTAKGGESTRVERLDGRWRVVEPVDFPADAVSLDQLASTLTSLASEGEIQAPQPPAVYGLDDPSRRVRFGVGEVEHGLRIGNATPIGSNTYAAVEGSDRVFMVPGWRVRGFQKTLDELRDRRVLDFDRASIARLRARWPGGGVVLDKRDDHWFTVEPVEGRADDDTVETLLSDLSFLRAEGFEDTPPTDAEAGLDPPAFELELQGTGEDGVNLRFALSDRSDGNQRLARGLQRSLYRVPAQRLKDFPRELIAYRFKQLASFAALEAMRFELEFQDPAGESLQVSGVRSDGEWETSPLRMDGGMADTMLRELARLKGRDILADAMGEDELAALGLAPPRARLRVFGEAPEEGTEAPQLAEVHLGATDAERGIPARAAEAEAVYWIEGALAEQLPVSLQAFRNRFTEPEPDLEIEPEPEAAPDQSLGEPLESLDAPAP